MEYRNIAQTQLRLSAITFGSWAAGGWMWGSTDRKDAVEAILASYDHGVTSIDTAPVYGQGLSEEIVGEAISRLPRDKVQILTKFGLRWDLAKGTHFASSRDNNGKPIEIYRYAGKDSVIAECEDSLRRLKTDYIDLYQIHWPDAGTPISETFEAVEILMKQGKIRYAGVCNYSAAQMEEANEIVPVLSNQIPFSMVNRKEELETIPYCIQNNQSVLAYSPMERGLLTGKMKPGQIFAEGDHRARSSFFTDESIIRTNAFLDKIRPIARQKNASLSQIVLRWTIDRPDVTIALAGARNAEQAIQNARASQVKLTPADIAFINLHLPQMK